MNLINIIKEEYKNILMEDNDIIDNTLDKVNSTNKKLSYLEKEFLNYITKNSKSNYKDIIEGFLDYLNLEYYQEKRKSFGKDKTYDLLLDTNSIDVEPVFEYEQNTNSVYILRDYYNTLYNIFEEFISEKDFDNIIINWTKNNLNNNISKLSFTFQNITEEEDYRGSHRAPTKEGGAPLNNVRIFFDDFYDNTPKENARYYGSNYKYGQKLASIILSYKDKPDEDIIIYRAIPNSEDIEHKINPGDWVSIIKEYAVDHGEKMFDDNYIILSKTVKASEIFTEGYLEEWGYDPS